MARIEITTEGLGRLAVLEQLPELSEAQFAEKTILDNLEENVAAEADGFIQNVLPDSLEAEGNNALNSLLRRRHITLQSGFRNIPTSATLEPKKKRSGPMSSMDFILGPDPDASDDNTHEEEKEEEPLGLAGDHFVDDLQDIDLRSGL